MTRPIMTASTALVAAVALTNLRAQPIPNFFGRWMLDVAETRRTERPLARLQAYTMVVTQTATDLTIEKPGTRWAQAFSYRLDGSVKTIVDDSLGDSPNFVRKIKGEAVWDGGALTVKTTPFGEQVDPKTGAAIEPAGAITTVQIFRLVAGGSQMTVDTTSFRAVPPAILHGKPYDPAEDAAVTRGSTEAFTKLKS